MAIEITDRLEEGAVAGAERGLMGADLLAGAGAAAVETVTNPRRAIRSLERKGAPVNTQLRRRAVRRIDAAGEAAQSYLPEQMVLSGLRVVKERARRKDLIGAIAFRALKVINDGLGVAGTVVQRMERASAPPSRGMAKAPVETSARAARTATRKVAAKTVSKTRGMARRATTAARRSERKPSAPRRPSARRSG